MAQSSTFLKKPEELKNEAPKDVAASDKENTVGRRKRKNVVNVPQEKCRKEATKGGKKTLNLGTLQSSKAAKSKDESSSKAKKTRCAEDKNVVPKGEITADPLPTKIVSDLESSNPSEKYWQELAEQRQKALEVTLYETAQVREKLEVLLAENSQIKGCLREAEKVAEIFKAALES